MLLALVAGLLAGIVAAIYRDSGGGALIAVMEPVGSIWVNALRMTLIPLVVSLLISVVGAVPDAKSTGRLGLRAFLVFVVFLTATGVVSVVVGPALVGMLPIDAATTAALQTGDAAAVVANAARMPTVAQTIIDIVPSNPVRAAADGAMLPLVAFALALGAAATRITPEQRAGLLGLFGGLGVGMLLLVVWRIGLELIGVLASPAALLHGSGAPRSVSARGTA